MNTDEIDASPQITTDNNDQPKSNDSTPRRSIVVPLEFLAEDSNKATIARKQLENLSKKPIRKISPTISENEPAAKKEIIEFIQPQSKQSEAEEPKTEIIYDGRPTMPNLTSAIISKEELEDEIRKKISKPDERKTFGVIEIPQDLILSEISSSSPAKTLEPTSSSQLDGQELIDILEGKPDDEIETFEVIGENGMFIVKNHDKKSDPEQTTSYEIVSPEESKMAITKQKILEREIAMRQIASMPTRKNRRLKQLGSSSSQKPTLAQSLAMEWGDERDEVIMELEGLEEDNGEPKIKILNMTILNEADEVKQASPKVNIVKQMDSPIMKIEPKILNKNAPKSAPKILNINAPQTSSEEPSSFKRSRVIKRKTIWDPSEIPSTSTAGIIIEKKDKLPIALPPSITIKKLTKESIAKVPGKEVSIVHTLPTTTTTTTTSVTPTGRKGKKKSEIDKLFQDEGAVNMIYSLERQNKNEDVPEITVSSDQSFVDKSEEKTKLIARTKTIRNTIMKQSTSPPDQKVTPIRPQRVKRDLTPSKPESEPEKEKKSPQDKTEKAVIVTKAQKNATVGRKRKNDDSWDYVRNAAQTTCDDAMIIRRHSNSSYSSTATSPRRLSLDQSASDDNSVKIKEEKNGFEFMKPTQVKSPEIEKDLKICVGGLVEELRNTLSNKLNKGKVQVEKTGKGKKRTLAAVNQESPPSKRLSERRAYGGEKEYQLIKTDGVAHLILNPFTQTLLSELKAIMNQLEVDDSCNVVLISASESFSGGLDYSTLIQSTVDKRKQAASDLVTAVK